MALAVMFADLGLRTVVLREISKPDSEPSLVIGAGLSLRLISVSVMVIVGAAIGLFMPYTKVVQVGLVLGGFYYVLLHGSMFFWAVFLRHLRQGQLMLAETTGGLVMLCGVVIAMVLDLGVFSMLMALVAGGLAQFTLSWYMAAKLQPFRITVNKRVWGDLVRMGLSLAGSEIALFAILRGDILILSILDSSESVGLYGVPSKIFEILGSLSWLFNGMIMPFFVAALANAARDQLKQILMNALDVMFVFGVGVVACCSAFAPELLTLIAGAEFAPAAPALVFVSLAIASHALSQTYRQLLFAMNLQHRALVIDTGCLVLAAAAYLILIPRLSYVGAGIGTAIVETTLALALALALRREGVPGLIPPSWWKIILAGVAAVIAMRGLSFVRWPWLLAIVSGGAVYLGTLVAIGAIPISYLRELVKTQKSQPE
jgi:O-antigen/teichoic acid export membrane protein